MRCSGEIEPIGLGLRCRALVRQHAIGTLVDRIAYGHVVDFLQFHYGGWYFPSFNVADSAITIGAVSLILDEVLRVRRAR